MDEPKKLPSIRTFVKDQKKVKRGNNSSRITSEVFSSIPETNKEEVSIPKPPVKKVPSYKKIEPNTSKIEIPKPPVKKSIPTPPKVTHKIDAPPVIKKEVVKTEPRIIESLPKKETPKNTDSDTSSVSKNEMKKSVETQVSLFEKSDSKKAKAKRTTKGNLFAGPATIITDTKKDRFRLFPAIGDSLKKWFEDNKKNFLTKKTPKYTVPETTRRKGVIQKATSKTGTFVASDHSLIYKRIKERDQETKERVASNDIKRNIGNVQVIKKRTTKETPEHTPTTTWSSHIESTFPLLDEGETNNIRKHSQKGYLTENQEIVVTDLRRTERPTKNTTNKIGWETSIEKDLQKNEGVEPVLEIKDDATSTEHVSIDPDKVRPTWKSETTATPNEATASVDRKKTDDTVQSEIKTKETPEVSPASATTTDITSAQPQTTPPTTTPGDEKAVSDVSARSAETTPAVSHTVDPNTPTAALTPEVYPVQSEKPPSQISPSNETFTASNDPALSSIEESAGETDQPAWSTEEMHPQVEPEARELATETSPTKTIQQTPDANNTDISPHPETQTALSQDEILNKEVTVPDSVWATAPVNRTPNQPSVITPIQDETPASLPATENPSAWSSDKPSPVTEPTQPPTVAPETAGLVPSQVTATPEEPANLYSPPTPEENDPLGTISPEGEQLVPTPQTTTPETGSKNNNLPLSNIEQKKKPTLRSLLYSVNINVLVFGVFFFIIIISLLVSFYIKLSGNEDITPIRTEPITEQPFLIEAPLKIVHLPNPKSETIVSTIKDLRDDRSVAITQLAFGATADNKTLVRPSVILSALGAELETNFMAAITHIYFGYIQSGNDIEPYIALRVEDSAVARGGMFVWEENMYNELEPVLASNVPEGVTLSEVELKFVDAMLGGVDVRLLEDVDGNERIIYGHINPNTIIITTNSLTFSKLLK